jgi:peptidoglycan DL-endopeptidase CwlO
VTGVERSSSSTARTGNGTRLVSKGIALSLVGVTVIATAISFSARPGSADSIQSDQAYAAQLVQQIQNEDNKISELNEQYDEAQVKLQQIDGQIKTNEVSVAHAGNAVQSDISTLRNQAVMEYISGGSSSGIAQLFSGSGTTQSDAQEYENLAGGDITSLIDQLHVDQQNLAVQRGQLNANQTAQRNTINAITTSKQQAQAEEQQLSQTLSQVRGRIATLVHQQQVAEQQAQERAFLAAQKRAQEEAAARAAAAAAAQAAAAQAAQAAEQSAISQGSSGSGSDSAPPAGSGAGEIAVHAAETQLGVPYVWGGSTPGVGFDCSGLTMWSWAQAGVELPHSAALQMQEVQPVSINDLQPGDLLFYYDSPGYVGHVTMYVGPGTMIQAEETGTDIMYTPIWYQNLAGAGRP